MRSVKATCDALFRVDLKSESAREADTSYRESEAKHCICDFAPSIKYINQRRIHILQIFMLSRFIISKDRDVSTLAYNLVSFPFPGPGRYRTARQGYPQPISPEAERVQVAVRHNERGADAILARAAPHDLNHAARHCALDGPGPGWAEPNRRSGASHYLSQILR
jgi:hypothetical protein